MGNRNFAPILIIIFVALIAVGLYMLKSGNNVLSKFFPTNKTQITSTLQSALAGELVDKFPKGLILPSDAEIQKSSVSHLTEQKLSLVSATYITHSKLADLYGAYISYFADNSFKVYLSDSKPGLSSIAARGDKYNVGVTISFLAEDTYVVQVDVNIPDAKTS